MSESIQKSILLVEDETLIALNEKMILEQEGYRVVLAAGGEDAVSIVNSDVPINLVLMDIDLGEGLDGTEAALIILENNDIPIVFLSSHAEKEIVKKTEFITSYGYIVKNSGETVMLASIGMAFKLFEAKQEIKSSRNTLDSTFNSINDAILLLDLDNNILKYNDAFKRFTNLNESQILGQKCFNLVHEQQCPPEGCPFKRMLKSGKREKMDMPVGDKYYEIIVDPLFGGDGKLINAVHIISDITKTKKIEEILQRRINDLTQPGKPGEVIEFEDLFDLNEIQKLQDDFSSATGVAAVITRNDGTRITKPSNFTKLCSEIIRGTEKGLCNCMKSDSVLGLFSPSGPNIRRCLSGGLWDAGTGITVNGKVVAKWLIGQVRDKSMSEKQILSYADNIGADRDEVLESFHDVQILDEKRFRQIAQLLYTTANALSNTAYQNLQQARMLSKLQSSELEIKELLKEKELLLKEVHHRMKNNMASIESLLFLQQRQLKDPDAAAAFQDSVLRVTSVRILYEKLLAAEEYQNLPVKNLVKDIINSIKMIFPELFGIMISYDIDDVVLDARNLLSFSLIVNELVTNIFKHAFSSEPEGCINFSFKKDESMFLLEISDNGAGLPSDFLLEENNSYGLLLIKMLAKQMGGLFLIENKKEPCKRSVSRVTMNL